MGQERMDSLALAHIHRYMDVDSEAIIDEFGRRDPRRLQFCRILEDESDDTDDDME